MALSDNIKLWFRGLFGTHNSSTVVVSDLVDRLIQGQTQFQVLSAVQANGLVNISANYFGRVKNNIEVTSVYYIPRGALQLNTANYAILQLQTADGAGGPLTTIANVTTQSLNMANGVPYALNVVAPNVDAGSVFAFAKLSILGAGTTGESPLPAGIIQIDWKER